MKKRELRLAFRASMLSLVLSGCHSPPRPPELATDAPDILATSLIAATREYCVPYVVDGASASSLTARAGVSEQHYDVNGQDVTRYLLENLPGQPLVTFSRQESCGMWLEVDPSLDRAAIDAAFRRDLQFEGYSIGEAHDVPVETEIQRTAASRVVGCVHGRLDALVTFSQSEPRYPIYVYVQTDDRYCARP